MTMSCRTFQLTFIMLVYFNIFCSFENDFIFTLKCTWPIVRVNGYKLLSFCYYVDPSKTHEFQKYLLSFVFVGI